MAREAFDTLLEAKVLIERRRQQSNTIRPDSAWVCRPPAPEARQPCAFASATTQGWSAAGQNRNLKTSVILWGQVSAHAGRDDNWLTERRRWHLSFMNGCCFILSIIRLTFHRHVFQGVFV